ncbi:MAG: flagellar export chaperone FlgN [Gemmatimonadetes bacterium]|mgnify:CR=1 FL=1|jgi:hypothetical protein|nr:flagellar export chaperone FlgN [Gemmatimonadota bacterium]MBP6444383.1 flagellar export chaperone FlgN [Gemmatimonadales bacterium]MBK7594355.1 flagellar export chaperone FlgN [Gemmatimonadota bacterium]MBK9548829.1 flagellar export chaperone FlgN [Gemmatimonadota bacterium]MBL0177551.1 flagellar export chaperone FlgN [Gemmatimonadota bacterium]
MSDVGEAAPLRAAQIIAAIQAEERLLSELRGALERQRAGIAEDDTAAIDAATHAVSRSVLTLDEARRRREQLVQLVSGGESVGLDGIDRFIGEVPGLREARRAVRRAAEAAVSELAMNQAILRSAMRTGDAYLQSLFSSVSGPASHYLPQEGLVDSPTPSGVVLDAQA